MVPATLDILNNPSPAMDFNAASLLIPVKYCFHVSAKLAYLEEANDDHLSFLHKGFGVIHVLYQHRTGAGPSFQPGDDGRS